MGGWMDSGLGIGKGREGGIGEGKWEGRMECVRQEDKDMQDFLRQAFTPRGEVLTGLLDWLEELRPEKLPLTPKFTTSF